MNLLFRSVFSKYQRIVWADYRGYSTSKELPQPYGEFTSNIRKVYDLDIIQWLCKQLKSARNENNKRIITSLKPSTAQNRIIEMFYGDLNKFFHYHSNIFLTDKQKTVQPILMKRVSLSTNSIQNLMEILIPSWGCVNMSIVAFFAGNLSDAEFYNLILEGDILGKRFIQVRSDVDKSLVFYRKGDEHVTKGHFKCNSLRIAEALEGSLPYASIVPSFWVPSEVCLRKLPYHLSQLIKRLGKRKIQGVLDGAIQFSTYKTSLFVRRNKASPLYSILPRCEQKYDEFRLTRMRVLKIAFCLPSEPSPQHVCVKNMFPGILAWAQNSAYMLWEIVRMYPDLMEIVPNGHLRSKIRSKYARFSPQEGKESLQSEEEMFEISAKMHQSEMFDLITIAGQPSDKVFRPVEMYNDYIAPYKERSPPFTEYEFVAFIAKSMEYHEVLTWSEIRDKIYASRNLADADRFCNTCTIMKVQFNVLERYVKENPNCGLHFRQERPEGLNYVETYFFRDDTPFKSKGNEYFDKKKLLDELVFQLTYHTSKNKNSASGNPAIPFSTLLNDMPREARDALRHYGGISSFARMYQTKLIVCLTDTCVPRLRLVKTESLIADKLSTVGNF